MSWPNFRWVAVTGSNGYIAGHTVFRLKEAGFSVLGCDLIDEPTHLKGNVDLFVHGAFTSDQFIDSLVNLRCEAVIHIAGTSLVGASVTDPGIYYHNNVGETAVLMRELARRGWSGPVVFSSSAAVYGNPTGDRALTEDQAGSPCSPYGHSKWMAEQVLADCARAYGHGAVSLRYFNACGADRLTRHGNEKDDTHLISRIMESMIRGETFTINGDDFDTPDGTCIRDYIHVEDLAEAHLAAIDVAVAGKHQAFNLGSGSGYSNREIVDTIKQITGQDLEISYGPRRDGDPARLTADATCFQKETLWRPTNSKLENIIQTAWRWYDSDTYRKYDRYTQTPIIDNINNS